MPSSVDRTTEHFARAIAALGSVTGSAQSAQQLLALLGWSLPPGVDDIGLVQLDLGVLGARLDTLTTLRSQQGTSDADLAVAVAGVVAALADAITHIEQIAASFRATPDYLQATGIVDQFFGRLADLLITHAVGAVLPVAIPAGALLGLFEFTHMPADPSRFQVEHVRQVVRWDRFSTLFTNPTQLLRDVYGWGSADFQGNSLVANIGRLVEFFAADARLTALPRATEEQLVGHSVPEADTAPAAQLLISLDKGFGADGFDAGLALYPLRPRTSGGTDGGIAVSPYLFGTTDTSFALSDDLSLVLSASEGLEGGLAVLVRAGSDPQLVTSFFAPPGEGSSALGADFSMALRSAAAGGDRLTLFSAPSLIVDAAAIRIGVGINPGTDLDLSLLLAIEQGRVRIVSDPADGFLASLVPADGLTATVDLELSWSHRGGVHFKFAAGLSAVFPLNAQVGPLRLDALGVALKAATDGLTGAVALSGSANIGPLTASVAGIGAALALRFTRGNLGPVDLGVAFQPPSGIGLSVEAAGAVTGGGFLFHDAAQGIYAGVMQLSLEERFTVSAFGLVATRMPDGSPGYSLIVFITAEDFQPIPLGLGFTLQGIGGMVAVNRTFDQDALRAGMQNDTLKSLLFPRDPVSNAPAIIRALSTAFPAQRGSYLLGVLARIGWFTPTLITLDLALILEFGARRRLLVLGRISSLLPSPDNDLVRINLDAIGVLDFDQDTASIDAMLVDSRLAHKFALTGAAALRAGWGSGPSSNFVLAVGGFNPRFAPPAGVPPLARVAIALCSGNNPRLTCEAYLAITANTIQFGARADLYAEAYSFSVAGDIGFDVLIIRAPLHFIADFHASVQLKHGSDSLFKVAVDGTLEGPRPLRLSGKASFEIFWCDFSVRFDKTLIDGEPPPPPPAVDVVAALMGALSTAQSWSTQPPAGRGHGVALRKLAPGTALVLDPLGRLAVREDVVPLDTTRDVEVFGGAPVAGVRRFALTATLENIDLTGQVTMLQAPFAPAQFFAMTDDEKLASPSFEDMDAGFIVGTEAVSIDAAALVAAPLEYDVIVIDALAAPVPPPAPTPYRLPAALLAVHAATGAAARAPVRRLGRARFRSAAQPAVSVAAPAWAITPLDAGPAVALDPSVKTWSEHQSALAALNRAGVRFQLVPARELAA